MSQSSERLPFRTTKEMLRFALADSLYFLFGFVVAFLPFPILVKMFSAAFIPIFIFASYTYTKLKADRKATEEGGGRDV